MFYLQYCYNFHKRDDFSVMNGQIKSKIITYTDKCSFMIHFHDIYVISDFFCSLVLIILLETTCCSKVIHQLYEMSFLFLFANQNIANASEILRIIKYYRNIYNFFSIYFFLIHNILGSSLNFSTCLSIGTKQRIYNSNFLREKVQNVLNLGRNRCNIYWSPQTQIGFFAPAILNIVFKTKLNLIATLKQFIDPQVDRFQDNKKIGQSLSHFP